MQPFIININLTNIYKSLLAMMVISVYLVYLAIHPEIQSHSKYPINPVIVDLAIPVILFYIYILAKKFVANRPLGLVDEKGITLNNNLLKWEIISGFDLVDDMYGFENLSNPSKKNIISWEAVVILIKSCSLANIDSQHVMVKDNRVYILTEQIAISGPELLETFKKYQTFYC